MSVETKTYRKGFPSFIDMTPKQAAACDRLAEKEDDYVIDAILPDSAVLIYTLRTHKFYAVSPGGVVETVTFRHGEE